MPETPESRADADLLLDHTSSSGPRLTHVRGTLIVGSRAGLELLGRYHEYVELLPAKHRDALLYYVAGSWIPMEETLAHFATCDRLGLQDRDFAAIGAALAERLAQTFLTSALRASRSLGADRQLWGVLVHCDRFLERVYKGGRCSVRRRGPKDALLELGGIPFVSSPYYRGVLYHQMVAVLNLFCRTLYVRPARTAGRADDSIAFSLNWV